MPKLAGGDLRKVTLNLYDTDVAWFQRRFGHGYTEQIRVVIHRHIQYYDTVIKNPMQPMTEGDPDE